MALTLRTDRIATNQHAAEGGLRFKAGCAGPAAEPRRAPVQPKVVTPDQRLRSLVDGLSAGGRRGITR